MDRRTTNTERRQKIHQILRDLNMLKCANTKIGSDGDVKILSGGEKKRLAFATEVNFDGMGVPCIVGNLAAFDGSTSTFL